MQAAEMLRAAVDRATPLLMRLEDSEAARAADGKWSPKQILGHLIDSASNNHQRFVRAQFGEDLVFPGYEQERWVDVQQYEDAPWPSLITLWREFNLHLARVMETTPEEVRMKSRNRHNLHQIAWQAVPEDEPATLDYFMRDYVGHLEHHLSQILA